MTLSKDQLAKIEGFKKASNATAKIRAFLILEGMATKEIKAFLKSQGLVRSKATGFRGKLFAMALAGPVAKADFEKFIASQSVNVQKHAAKHWAMMEMANAIWAQKAKASQKAA